MHLIPSFHLSRREHIVHIFKEPFIFDFIIREYESDSLPVLPCDLVQDFQVVH